MKVLDWYFDVVSPFSYLQFTQLHRIEDRVQIRLRPILFAGLLKHWGNIGPAEIGPKRIWTFEHCAWLAHRNGIELKLPPSHPFNPLPLLRLTLAASTASPSLLLPGVASKEVTRQIFEFVWLEGQLPEGPAWDTLMRKLGVTADNLNAAEVKDALARNGEDAIAAQLFGVPSSVIDQRAFWGFDATEMLIAWIDSDPFFQSEVFHAASTLAPGLMRTLPPRVPT